MPKTRKIEYFRKQLKVSAAGRELIAIVQQHGDEVLYLINKNRPTMICWQKNHGPKFIKSLIDSGYEEEDKLVKEIEGVKIESLILQMAEVLQDFGSPELKMAIGKYTSTVLGMLRQTNSIREMIYRINNTQNAVQHG